MAMVLLRKVLDRINLTDLLICAILFIFVAFLSGSYAVFYVVTFVLAASFFSLAVYHHKMDKLDKKKFNYSVAFFSFISMCSITVVARNFTEINLGLALILLFLCIAILSASFFLLTWFKTVSIKFSKELLLKYLPFAILALFVFLLSLPLFKSVPLFDEWFYYDNLSNDINLSTLNSIDKLKMCGHMSHFWTIMVYVINCCIGDLYASVILFNVLLLMISIPIVYKLVKFLCPGCSCWFAYLCTIIFAFSPYTFGFVGYMYPQTILVYSLLFFLSACLAKDKVLIFVTAIMLIFTFETSIFVTSMLLFLPVLFSLASSIFSKNFLTELKKQGFNLINISLLLIHILWFVIFLQRNWAGIGYEGDVAGGVWFKFNQALYENLTFLANFTWILYAGIVTAFVKLLIQFSKGKLSIKSVIDNKPILTIVAAFSLLLMSSTFLTTLNYIRYILPIFTCSYLLFFISIYYLLKDIKARKARVILGHGVLASLSILLAIQSNITIDPIMLSSSQKIYMGSGNNYLVNVAYRDITKSPFDEYSLWYYFDPYIYNRQLSNSSNAFNKVLSSINYNINKCIVVSSDISNQYLFENKYYGLGYKHAQSDISKTGFHGWDQTKKQQYITYDKNEAIRYTLREDAETIQALLEGGEYEEYWFLDYNSRIGESIQYFAEENNRIIVEKSHDVSYMGWKFTLSKICLGA